MSRLNALGDFVVPLRLHREVTVELQVKVSAEGQVIAGHMTPEQEAELNKKADEAEGGKETES